MRLGLIVNPIAGVGGSAALRGSDGPLAGRAIAAGAEPRAPVRAVQALTALAGISLPPILAAAGAMGSTVAAAARLPFEIVHHPSHPSGAADTIAAARAIADAGAELIVFAGGDGTARDLIAAAGAVPVLGIPAGVKMLSAVFATSPRAAGALLRQWAVQGLPPAPPADVLDRDDRGAIQLYGALAVPMAPAVQRQKATVDGSPGAELTAAAHALADELRLEALAIVGPGASMAIVKQALAGVGTLLGVDAFAFGVPIALDADAARLTMLARAHRPRIALGVIGGQGFLLGRGNQQITAGIVRAAGRSRIDVLAAAEKLVTLPHGALMVDSGDPDVDAALIGHLPVRIGPRRRMMMVVQSA